VTARRCRRNIGSRTAPAARRRQQKDTRELGARGAGGSMGARELGARGAGGSMDKRELGRGADVGAVEPRQPSTMPRSSSPRTARAAPDEDSPDNPNWSALPDLGFTRALARSSRLPTAEP
jgi:hypothetical protein